MRQETHRSMLVPVLAWGLCALYPLLWLTTVALFTTGDARPDALELTLSFMAVSYALVGALVAVREPRNAVGWLLLAIATSFVISGLVEAYVSDLDRPFVAAVTWSGNVLGETWAFLAALALPLVFPDGRLLSPRWRTVLWLGVAAMVLSGLQSAFAPGRLDDAVPIRNPLGVDGAAETVVTTVGVVSDVLFVVAAALSILSCVLRLRRSHGRTRQQVTWFAYVASLALGGLLLASAEPLTDALEDRPGAAGWIEALPGIGWVSAALLMIVGIPAAVGTAILRHHLYDIDLVVKRTLVYGSLTLTLGAVYLGSVLGLRLLLRPLAGHSDLAVAGSTLAVAALFRPVRSRIQQLVDRRFYRSKYDAAKTVESFAGRLRHEVDLAAVTGDLEVVVRDTVQPTHVSLWLRGAP